MGYRLNSFRMLGKGFYDPNGRCEDGFDFVEFLSKPMNFLIQRKVEVIVSERLRKGDSLILEIHQPVIGSKISCCSAVVIRPCHTYQFEEPCTHEVQIRCHV